MSIMDTTENPKEFLGREKPCIQYIPMKLMLRLAAVHKLGADKYGQKNWRIQPIRMSTYYNAIYRHLVDWFEGGENTDPESKEHLLLHVIADCLIILDAMEHNSIADDREFAEVKTGKLAGTTNQDDPADPRIDKGQPFKSPARQEYDDTFDKIVAVQDATGETKALVAQAAADIYRAHPIEAMIAAAGIEAVGRNGMARAIDPEPDPDDNPDPELDLDDSIEARPSTGG